MSKEFYDDLILDFEDRLYPDVRKNWEFIDTLDFREDLLKFKDYLGYQVNEFMDKIEKKFKGKELPKCCGGRGGFVFNNMNADELATYLLRRYPDIIEDIEKYEDYDEYDQDYWEYYFIWKGGIF